jgi:type IV pilus assembly protein PilA
MRIPMKGEKGFTLIELLIVVAILGILAAVVIPNVGRFLGRGQDEARRAEGHDIGTAVTALMVENNLASIPTPYASDDAPCTTGTQDMNVWPDSGSVVATADKTNDPSGTAYTDGVDPLGDKDGFVLFGHDITADNDQATLVNYINFDTTTSCYTIASNGTVRQYDLAGVEYTD